MNHPHVPLLPTSEGIKHLANFLIHHRLASQEAVNAALASVEQQNARDLSQPRDGQENPGIAASLLAEIGKSGVDLDPVLSTIVDHTKFPFIPLDSFEVDRQIVKMLPESLTLGRLVVPFDIFGRTMMVAVENPFDACINAAIQQMVDYQVQWFLAHPVVIRKVLCDAYRIAE